MKPRRGRQSGAALLALVFVVVAASTYLLVLRLNAATRPYQREQQTVARLNEAKQSLIAYALSFPDLSGTTDPTAGPGYLPCPDTDNDGSPNPPCGGPVALGRFPGEWLDVSDYEDNAGERFWYALSGNYRNNPKLQPMNSDTPGQLSVDTETDVVAVIIAPGAPTETQTGRPSLTSVHYLEGENADGDTAFSRNAGGNDRLVYITRQELIQAIEKRVLGDVGRRFSEYQAQYGAYPWLSPFANPATSSFRGVSGTRQGHIPFHWTGSPAFTTDVSLSWSISNSVITNSPWGWIYLVQTPDLDCVTSNTCADENYPGLSNGAPLPLTDADCLWVNKEIFKCTATYVVTTNINHTQQSITGWAFWLGDNQWILKQPEFYLVRGKGECLSPCVAQTQYAYSETVTRTYDINMTFTDNTADGVEISGPSVSAVRTRDLTLEDNGSSLVSTGNNDVIITITDMRTITVTEPGPDPVYTITTSRTLNNGVNTTGTIAATGIHYDLDGLNGYDANADGDFEDPGDVQPTEPELPSWFVKNHWHDLIYVAYPSVETVPGGAATACIVGTNCLTLNGVPPINNNKRAIVMAAGSVLPTNLSRPNASRNAYFEGENAEPANEIFEKTAQSATSNDQIRVLATSP